MTLEPSLWISLRVALMATALVVLVGLPLAWALSRPGWPGKTLLDIAVNLPLVLPPTVLGYYLLLLIGRDGPVGRLTESLWGSTLIFTQAAAVLAASCVSLPLFVQVTRNALEDIPQDVIEAATVSGASRWEIFRYIAFPLAQGGIWIGLLLAFARALGEFGATVMVAGNIPGRTQTMALAIYSAVQAGNHERATTLAVYLTMVGSIAMWAGFRRRALSQAYLWGRDRS